MIFTATRLLYQVPSETTKNGAHPKTAVDITLLLHVISCEILHFVTSCMSQNKKRKQTLETAQCGLKIIVIKVRFILIIIQGKPKKAVTRWKTTKIFRNALGSSLLVKA